MRVAWFAAVVASCLYGVCAWGFVTNDDPVHGQSSPCNPAEQACL